MSPISLHHNGLKRGLCKSAKTDLYFANTLETFDRLAEKYNLRSSEYYTYLQIIHWLSSQNKEYKNIQQKTYMEHLCKQAWNGKRLISDCYKLLLAQDPDNKLPYMHKWEQDLQKTFATQSLTAPQGATNCTNHREAYIKLIHRCHLTPQWLSKIIPIYPRTCWRECGSQGNVLHMWWECPIVIPFWKHIFHMIEQLLTHQLSKDPEIALLQIYQTAYTRATRKLLFHVFNSATTLIAKY